MTIELAQTLSSHSQLYSKWTLKDDLIKRRKLLHVKTPGISNCLNTRFCSDRKNYHEVEKLETTQKINGIASDNFNLPVVIRHDGAVSRCVWDGSELKLVPVDGANTRQYGMKKLSSVCRDSVRNFFLPKEVGENYIEYVKWKFLHRVFSSALQVLATQAMFRAIGIGYSRSLPSAAAFNWVLKDGLGRLSKCIYTACFASAFDTNLKRVRFSTSILFTLSIGIELLTPTFPQYFLFLATVANIIKQISHACHIATGSAVNRSFAIADNLGEISAKSQIQTVCFDNIGLLIAASFNFLLRNNQRLLAALPFILYPIFSAFDLIGIYQGLKHVHLQTLTKDRLELIINIWTEQGYVPSQAEVSKMEGVDFLWSKGDDELLPIRIGCLNPKKKIPKLSMMTLRGLQDKDFCFICLESIKTGCRISDLRIVISLRNGAATKHVIMGLLQACYIRKALLMDTMGWEKRLESCECYGCINKEWFTLMEESKKFARQDLDVVIDKMLAMGWACKNVLLSTQEQQRYSFATDAGAMW